MQTPPPDNFFPHILWILTENLYVIRVEVRFAYLNLWAVGTDNHGKPHLIDVGTNWYSEERMALKTQREMLFKRTEALAKRIDECDNRLDKIHPTFTNQQ